MAACSVPFRLCGGFEISRADDARVISVHVLLLLFFHHMTHRPEVKASSGAC